ncbi:MAG: hypothetical protein HKN45_05530 [Flavobacteriales bacterium]|nr:hypothetical protein [Flavobacteriales bacterium]
MRTLFIFILCLFISTTVISQSGAKKILKLTEGRQAFLKRNYWGALDSYRQVLKENPDGAIINYRVGETQYALKHYDIAKQYLERALELDDDVDVDLYLMLGKTYHRLEELDNAKEYYRMYREISSDGRSNRHNVSGLIAQCDYAKQMMASPVEVEIRNLDKEINSRFDDYAPSVTADGKMMVYTSRRPSETSNAVDENGDHKYFEDIYYSEWNEEEQNWESGERFSSNVNSETHDAVLSINGTGDRLFVYKNDSDHAGDIYVSRFTGDWSLPEKLPKPINTSYFESSISMTADGSTMYFISERPSGMGRGDVYMSRKTSETNWSKPKNLGEVINTPFDEKFVFIHPNGNTLFFASNGHLTLGSYDIFRSEFKDGQWSDPVNLGYPINTVNEESTFSMTADNKRLLISAEYHEGLGERDIYEIDLSNTDILHSLNIDSDLLGKRSNVTVYGRISIQKGQKPGAFLDVAAYDNKGEVEVFKTRTDRRGNYEMSLPRDKNYLLKVSLSAGVIKQEKFNLKNMLPSEIDYQLNLDY